MNIKSDRSNYVIAARMLNNTLKDLSNFFEGYYIKFTIITVLLVASFYTWFTYSGFIGVWLGLTSLSLLATVNEKDAYLSTLLFSVMYALGLIVVALNDSYKTEPIYQDMTISKYEFTNTEKLVVHVTKPLKTTLVFSNIPNKTFYTMRESDGNKMIGKISKMSWYDHIDKLTNTAHKSTDHIFTIEVSLGGETYTQRDYCDRIKVDGRNKCAEIF